jgi:hypothetical protein
MRLSSFWPYKRKIFDYKHGNWDGLKEELENTNWEDIHSLENVDKMAEAWTKKYMEIIRVHIPSKQVKIWPAEAPWMSNKIRFKMRKRNKAYKKAKKRNTDTAWHKFRVLRNEVISDVREAKAKHKMDLEENINKAETTKSKLWWKLVKQVLNKQKSKTSPPLKVGNKYMTSPQDKANAFNKYFAQQSTLNTDGKEPPQQDEDRNENVMQNMRISFLTVKEILQNLDANKASGPDEVSTRLLKQTSEQIAPSLARIFNYSLQTGRFLGIWKEANVTPLYKNKRDREDLKNYRPVSLLSCIGKVMERCVHNQVFNFFIRNNLLSKYQSAFMPGSSTIRQMLELYHQIQTAMDNSRDMRFIFLDISKAFDKVWHKGIIAKLHRSGIRGKLLNWFKGYLSGRKQKVVHEGSASTQESIEAGVPQGSILGPLLFLIYINDLVDDLNCNVRMYADDTTLYLDYVNPVTGAQQLEDDLRKIERWAETWLVQFNPTKSESLLFSRKRNKVTPNITMGNKVIEEVTSHCHLGITLQRNGKWSQQIQKTVTKAKKRVDILRSLMYCLGRKSIEKLYKSFIMPILEYGGIIWDNCNDYEKEELEKIQLAACRAITGAKKGTSHQLLYIETGLEPLAARRERQKLVQMYKMKNNLAPSTLQDLLPQTTSQRTQYSLRSADDLTHERATTTALHQSFIPSTVRMWNNMIPEWKHATSLEQFKEMITPKKVKVPKHFYSGERKAQINQTRLRLRCSNLQEDLYNINLADTPMCNCGTAIEDAEHYLKECSNYQELRDELAETYPNWHNVEIETMLYGDLNLDEKSNRTIFEVVQKFINQSARFG